MSNQPLALDEFWLKLRISSITFDMPDEQTGSGTARGEVLRASRGDVLWAGKAVISPNLYNSQDQAKALMDEVRLGGARFLVCDPLRSAPQSDRFGNLQGESTAIVSQIDPSDRRRLILGGLPAGFVMTPGDLVSLQYGANPVRHFLARVTRGGVFAGINPQCDLRVLPFLPDDLALGQAVTLRNPVCAASYVPNSYTPVVRHSGFDGGFEFQWRQTYR